MTLPEEADNIRAEGKKIGADHPTRKRKGGILIFLGILLILGSISLTTYNLWDNERAGRASDQVLQSIDTEIGAINPEEPSVAMDQDTMHTINIDGYDYIGTIEIPSLEIRLPVMAAWDYTRLKISPCLYSGSYLEDNMVICGHNYRKHFSPIKWIDIGEEVNFITVDKVVYQYKVSNRITVQPTSIPQMVENLEHTLEADDPEDWDLTLFTCNPGGQTRCAVRCIRVQAESE